MNELRSILLHVDAAPRCSERARLAAALAAQQGAALDAVYAATPAVLTQPFALAEGALATLQLLEDLDEGRRSQARQRLQDAAGAATWSTIGEAMPVPGMVPLALLADLLVLGQHDAENPLAAGTPPDFVESLLLACGKPALVVPCVGSYASVGQRVLVAWKSTPESAHALAAALPLLRSATEVHLIGVSPDDQPRLQSMFERHGISAAVRRHAPLSDHTGELLLSLAADVGADLMVMGCYGHSRARELVLGGVTRTVLGAMTLPVLMAH